MKKVLCVTLALSIVAACSDPFFGIEQALKLKYGANFDCYEHLHDMSFSDGAEMKVVACVGDDNIARLVYIIDGEVTL